MHSTIIEITYSLVLKKRKMLCVRRILPICRLTINASIVVIAAISITRNDGRIALVLFDVG
jgi:hypothetical protein